MASALIYAAAHSYRTGLKKVAEENLIDLQKTYGTVTIVTPLEAHDDRPNKYLHLFLSLPRSQHLKTHRFNHFRGLFPHPAKYLDTHINPERTAPHALSYPLWVKEHIHVENPLLEWETVISGL